MAFAAVIAALLLGAAILLQLALAAGAPLGLLAWGGRDRVLPAQRRVASFFAAGLLALSMWTILSRAGMVAPGPQPSWVRIGTWMFCGMFLFNTLGNFASRSRWERTLMTPTTAILAVCFAAVAFMAS